MRLVYLFLSGAALAAVFFFTPTRAQAGLVTNGSFETGDFTGWTIGRQLRGHRGRIRRLL